MTTRAKFSEVRAGLKGDAVKAFDMLSRYFPIIDGPNITIDLVTSHKHGGTFLSNWEMNSLQASIAIETLKELGCNCFFVVPVPSWKGFPEHTQKDFKYVVETSMEACKLLPGFPFPPFFAIHTYAASQECGMKYAYLALAKLQDSDAYAKAAMPKDLAKAEAETTNLMQKLGAKKI